MQVRLPIGSCPCRNVHLARSGRQRATATCACCTWGPARRPARSECGSRPPNRRWKKGFSRVRSIGSHQGKESGTRRAPIWWECPRRRRRGFATDILSTRASTRLTLVVPCARLCAHQFESKSVVTHTFNITCNNSSIVFLPSTHARHRVGGASSARGPVPRPPRLRGDGLSAGARIEFLAANSDRSDVLRPQPPPAARMPILIWGSGSIEYR